MISQLQKLLIILGFLSTVITPSLSFAVHFSAIEGKFDCPNIHNSHNCARSIESKLLENTGLIKRNKLFSLIVTLKNGTTKTYQDSTEENPPGEKYTYSALEFVADSYLLIYRQLWESSDYILLSLKNGVEYSLEGYPLTSPNGQYILTVEQDLDAGFNENLLELYLLTVNGLTPVYSIRPESWGPSSVSWETNNQVKFIKKQFNPNYSTTKKSPLFFEDKALLRIESDNRVIFINIDS
ncbi:hypothetical protein ACJJIG_21870 [Microbulbifer sp. SSSA007]|uniref:hypothetical protein n=1 Tax=Microbulbifer sp. SSSA007 TaxID=3243379 RepID=UPI004039B7EB